MAAVDKLKCSGNYKATINIYLFYFKKWSDSSIDPQNDYEQKSSHPNNIKTSTGKMRINH